MDARAESLAINRLRHFARFCLLWGGLILFRLVQLQIFDHAEYQRLAQQQQERDLEIRAPRGVIFDRNGQQLAMSVSVDSVCINPQKIPDLIVAAGLLARVLHLDERVLLGKMAEAKTAHRGFLWVKRKASEEEAQKLRSYHLEWVEFRPESTRSYPKGALAAHVLGGVDHEEKGNGGIEKTLDKDLRGEPGIVRTTADVRRNVFDAEVRAEPQAGKNITLTIDERIQYIAESELARAVEEHGASTGSLVAMNPATGEVLALANYPSYDPNVPPKSQKDFEGRRNLAVSAPFEPGSVFKVVTLSAALDSTRLSPDSLFDCQNGAMTLFRRVIHDAHPHGTLSMAQVLEKSSNIGAIKIALKVGNENLHQYVRRLGFGAPTGIGLPGESGGVVRPLRKWIPSSIGSIAMGHEMSATTVQLAQACSVIANGGLLTRPYLVKGTARPEPVRVLKPETAIKMRAMMRGVVHNEGATGKRARLIEFGYSAGGKTGSAQIYDYKARVYTHRYNGSFMGFAPANNPQIVVVVTLNGTRTGNAGFGGVVAAPVFQKVMSAALRFLGVPKDLPDNVIVEDDDTAPEPDLAIAELTVPNPPEEEEEGDPAAETVSASAVVPTVGPAPPPAHPRPLVTGPKVPDFQGKTLRTVLEQSSALGVRVEFAGSGIARRQYPQPGAVLQPGERIRVLFAR